MQDFPARSTVVSSSGADLPGAGAGLPSDPSASVVVVAVGGFDPTGGAGVVRDLLTARTLNAGVRLVPTAWTAQSAAGVRSVEPRNPAALATAVADALADAGAEAPERVAVKLGMMPDAAAAGAVLDALRGFAGPIVFDPVLGASSGGALYAGEPRALLALAARASVVTPNAGEAERLTGERVADLDGATCAGQALIAAGAPAALIKGGHLTGAEAIDLLVTAHNVQPFAASRLHGPPVRGTGCALATAIAVGLARGQALESAVGDAKAWLHQALQHAVPAGAAWHLC